MEMNQKSSNIKKCEICENEATSLCFKCISYFCDSCYKFIHDKQNNSLHKRKKQIIMFQQTQNAQITPKFLLLYFVLMKKVNKFYFINNLLSNIELCCPQCYYLNIHSGHKVLQIVDEELIKKEDITLDSSLKGFNEDIKKIISLREKIENEINKIDKLYDKVMNEVTKSFEIKHEKLIKEENDLKEKLQIEVTKVKE